MNRYIYILFAITVVGMLTGCKKMSYFQTNPNAPSSAVSSSILTSLEINLFSYPNATNASNDEPPFDVTCTLQYNVGFASHSNTGQYYQWTTTSMNEYLQIEDAQTMIGASGGNAGYTAIGKLFQAIKYYYLTNELGDVPCSQAGQLGSGGTRTPVYDPQKSVYQTILADLDTANNLLSAASGVTVLGDFLYNGDLTKWRKFVNSFRLRVILSLSNKTGDTDLQPMALFANVMNNPSQYPIFTSNSDNAQQATSTVTPTPLYNNPAYVYYGMAKAFHDSLTAFQDPRIVHWYSITAAAKAAGKSVYDYTAYAGLPSDATIADNTANQALASIPNVNYFSQANYEPNLFEGYYEVSFEIAEGIARGWWSGADAQTYYTQGITASMSYYGIPQDTVTRYLSGPHVVFDPSRALQQILYQRYLAGVFNSGWESYFTQRRTNYPQMALAGPGMVTHLEALRFQYPVNEYTLNAANVNAAVTRQYGSGGDVITAKMWSLIPE